jgi:hypothetical protein
MMTFPIKLRLLFLSALLCMTSVHLSAMETPENVSGTSSETLSDTRLKSEKVKASFLYNLTECRNCFFNGWKPTLLALVAGAVYWARYDRQAPQKALSWTCNTFKETHWLVKYPIVLLGACVGYEYYKPRITASWQYLQSKMSKTK